MGDTMQAADLEALKAVAEDPFIAPSKRVAARKILREHRANQMAAQGDRAIKAALQAKVAQGEPMTWRERQLARDLGLVSREG